MKVRYLLLIASIMLVYLILLGRLFYWQVIRGKELSMLGKRQYENINTINSQRGEILASDGSWLAGSAKCWTLYANPKKIDNNERSISNKLAKIIYPDKENEDLIQEAGRIEDLLKKKELFWVSLKTRLDELQKDQVEKLQIDGIGFEEEESRVYPEASSSAHILGFLGKDESGKSIGYFGLEGYYNDTLIGKKGISIFDSDVRGIPILLGGIKETKAIKGFDLVTTIEKPIQIVVEKELEKGIEKYQAKGGTVIVMNPFDGRIIAMASNPSFDPAKYFVFNQDLFVNPAISRSFEPGSVFKVLIMAFGLDSGVINTNTVCDVCNGPFRIGKYSIETWNKKYYPNSSMLDIIVHSDNVGMSYIGMKLGVKNTLTYLNKLGFGKTTGIDLQGEMSPKLRDKKEWGEIDLATVSFGQGIAITPIQLIRGVSSIANGGLLVKPYLVKEIKSNTWLKNNLDSKNERVFKEKTTKDVTAMMVEAAKSGEAKWTHLSGFKVAGKTGTAQIPIQGHYDEDKTIASFIGFAPYDNPKFIMLVTLNEPQSSQWASETAAPMWYSIAKNLFIYYKILPE